MYLFIPKRSVTLQMVLTKLLKGGDVSYAPIGCPISSVGPTSSPRFRNIQRFPKIPKSTKGFPKLPFEDTVFKSLF